MLPNTTDSTNDLIPLCAPYYSPGVGYYSESQLSGLSEAMQRISETFNDEYNDNPCVNVTLNYLCNYYFPSCNMTNGKITPVCNSSCYLLGLTEDCPELMEVAYEELEQDNVTTPDEECSQTYRSYINPPETSGNCLAVEG